MASASASSTASLSMEEGAASHPGAKAEAEAQVNDVLASGGVKSAHVRCVAGSGVEASEQWRALFDLETLEGVKYVVIMTKRGFRKFVVGEPLLDSIIAQLSPEFSDEQLMDALAGVCAEDTGDVFSETLHGLLLQSSPQYGGSFHDALFAKLQAVAEQQNAEQ